MEPEQAPTHAFPRGTGGRGLRLLACVAIWGCLVGSLGYRAWQRGPYYPGWDVLGPAHGVYVLSTLPPDQALVRLARGVYTFRYWNATNSLIYTTIPGLLGCRWPSPYWGHWLTLGLVFATFAAAWRFSELPSRHAWLLALAWCASPALLSFAVAGYPYATGFLPHALALVIVTSRRLVVRPFATLLAALLASELSWHLYEAGKTLIVVFVIAAIVERRIPRLTRSAWLAAAALQAARLFSDRGYNVDYVVTGAQAGVPAVARAAGRTLGALLRPEVDLPVLVPLGMLALPFVRRHRWLLLGGLLSQLATVAMAAVVEPTAVRPRRLLTTSFYCITILAVAFKDSLVGPAVRQSLVRTSVVTALAVGSLWQVGELWLFYRVPPAGRTQPLPFTASPDDYHVATAATELAARIQTEVAGGQRAVLLYNLSSETLADPAALLERVYLTLGHRRFAASVLAFGARQCRYDCLPVRPLADITTSIAALAGESPRAVAFYKKRLEPRRHVEESALVLDALAERFSLRPEADPAPGFGRLALLPRVKASTAPVAFEEASEPLPLDLAWLPDPRVPGERVLTSPDRDRAFRHVWSATAVTRAGAEMEFLLGGDGTVRLEREGTVVVERRATGLSLWCERLELPAGRSRLRLQYETRSGAGRLLMRPETACR